MTSDSRRQLHQSLQQQTRRIRDVTFNIFTAALVCELTLSANLLTWLGIPYVSDGGSILTKLHPGSYLIAAGLLAEISGRRGTTLYVLWFYMSKNSGVTAFIIGMSICIIFALALTGPGSVIVLLDTFMPAGLIALFSKDLTQKQRNTLRMALETCLALNASLALLEGAMQSHFIPLYLNGEPYQGAAADFRPTGLYDHPLTGSSLTMIGILLPRSSGSGPLNKRIRPAYLFLLWTSLLAFGSRTAFLLTCLASLVKGIVWLTKPILQRKPLAIGSRVSITAVCFGAPVLAMLLYAMGIGTRLAGHLYWDASANVRVGQWQILTMLDATQLVFGCRRDDLLSLLNVLYLGSGIEVVENFWLLEFLSLGMLVFPIFVAALFALLTSCMRRAGSRSIYVVVGLLIAASSSNSLGRKSNLLVVLIGAISTLQTSQHRRIQGSMNL